MPQDRYLSTDPTAGEYLSTDPNAGQPVTPAAPKKDDTWLDTAKKVISAIPGLPKAEDLKVLTEWLPTVGGAVGGLAGVPGGLPGMVGGAALGGAAGEGLRQNARRVMGESAPGTMTGAITAMGKEAGIQGGSELVGGKVIAPLMRHGAAVAMQSAVKPGIKGTAQALMRGVKGEDLPIVKTLLKEGVNVSPGGIAKLDRVINATNEEIRAAINSIPDAVISPTAVAKRTESVASQVAKQVDPEDDISAVAGVTRRFLEQDGTTKAAQIGTKDVPMGVLDASGRMLTKEAPVMGRVSRDLTLPEAQAMKSGTYRALKEKSYGELKAPAIEAQKALARGLKEEIEIEAKKAGVDIAAVNAREGAAITAKEAVARRVAAAGNREPIAMAWLAANPTAGMLFVLERSPAVKSMIARGLYQSASRAAQVPENVIRLLVSSLATSGDDQ